MYFEDLEQVIPQQEADLKIGSLRLWLGEYSPEKVSVDYSAWKTFFLLKTEKVVALSPNSYIKLFELRNLHKDLIHMYDKIGSEQVVEAQLSDSEFGLKFTSNVQGKIAVEILYRSWAHAGYGRLEFEEKIDQSYLPPIISGLEILLKKIES